MWKYLAKIALLGTEHSTFSEDALKALQDQGFDIDQEHPELLLESAAQYGQINKAGFRLENFTGALPESADSDEGQACSFKSANHLRLILDGKFPEMLPEFISHLLENSKTLPTSMIPALMARPDIGQWWDLLEMTFSSSGRWLLRQHPIWQRRLMDPSQYNWQTGVKFERIELLKYLRKVDPERAVEMLKSTWKEENYRDKAAFLKELETGLSIDDEAFVNDYLSDRRKEVRKTAAFLLAKIPGSEYGERMFKRAMECFDLKRGKLEIDIPDEPDQVAVRDGILKIHPDWKGGTKAGYLGQIIAKIPPVRWEMHFERGPVEVLELFSRTDWENTLNRAIAEAAVFHQDPTWTGALLSHWFEEENAPLWNLPVGIELLEQASGSVVNRLLLAYLQNHHELPDEETPFYHLLQVNDAPWDNDLTLLIISRFREWLLTNKTQRWHHEHYQEYLKMIANRCNPDLFPVLQKSWNTNSPMWYQWEKPVEEMLNTVLFRKEMINELQKI